MRPHHDSHREVAGSAFVASGMYEKYDEKGVAERERFIELAIQMMSNDLFGNNFDFPIMRIYT